MFKLLKYFSITSFIAIVVVIAALVALYRQSEINQLVRLTEEQNIMLSRSLSNSFWKQFGGYVTAIDETEGASLRARPETQEIRKTLELLTNGLPILKVKVFNQDGITIFSSEAAQIGENAADNVGFQRALHGTPASSLVHKDTITTFSGEALSRDVVESYVTIANDAGEPEAVFELYTDVTKHLEVVENTVRKLTAGLIAAFGLLYGVLFLIVRRADGILKNQYQEIRDNADRMHRKNTELRELRNMALKASRAKTDLMANMSHELRTPLNAIIGFSDTIRSEVLGPIGNDKYLEYIRDIHASGRHLLDLINDILDVAAIEEGALILNEEAVDTAAVAQSCLRLIEPRATVGGIRLGIENPRDFQVIHADMRRIKQVLLNLLSNAVKYTPEDGTVTVAAKTQKDGRFSITVRDTGVGMTQDEMETALSKFGQVDSGLDRKHEGTGLGLPLTKGLMDMHDGDLTLNSEKGHGTEVTMTFPANRVVVPVRLP